MGGDMTRRRRAIEEVNCRLQIIGGIAQHLLPAQVLVFSHSGPRQKVLGC
jgi:hypothetical protein